ncbi:MAG: glycosyltransferase family 1 protein [Bacteroidales bacterium]|nr:glycosyltransferase family 1 protein [Bacteroidales bacterium]
MSFKILIISSLYTEYLKQYYQKHSFIINTPFDQQYLHLLEDTSEPVGSYIKMYNKLGIDARCIIENADFLQRQWAIENNIKTTDDKHLIYEQIKSFNPEILWIENINLVEKDWINYLRSTVPSIRLVIANHCAPYNSRIIERFKNLDFIITCTPGIRDDFEKNGLKSFHVYHGFNPAVLDKINDDNNFPQNDFVFSGSLLMGGGFHRKRIELIESIFKENIDLKIYGNLEKRHKIRAKQSVYYAINILNKIKMGGCIRGIPLLNKYEEYGVTSISNYSKKLIKATEPPVFGIDMFKLLKNAKIILNNHGEVAGEYAGNMRLFEATGVGSCLITDSKKNMEELFVKGDEVVLYDSFEECIEKVKWLLNNENERMKIAKSGQGRTLKTHSVEERCKLLISIIAKELRK